MKRALSIFALFVSIPFISGCSLPGSTGQSASKNESFLKSSDAGKNWEAKMKIDEKQTIASADILSIAIDKSDSKKIYLGTAANGIYFSKDGSETWTNVKFPTKVYGLVIDPRNSDTLYAGGVLNGRGKIYKREGENQEWKEIYTEPADGTYITTLSIDAFNPQVLYAGTNNGVLIKSSDGGYQWNNLFLPDSAAGSPVANIVFDAVKSGTAYVTSFQRAVYVTTDGGGTFSEITNKMHSNTLNNGVVNVVVADPISGGTLYAGMDNGILKSIDGGEKWEPVNVIASSKQFPIRAIAINPKNNKEILYSSAKAIYRSSDGGAQWSTFQLDTTKNIGMIKFDPQNSDIVYAGLRSL